MELLIRNSVSGQVWSKRPLRSLSPLQNCLTSPCRFAPGKLIVGKNRPQDNGSVLHFTAKPEACKTAQSVHAVEARPLERKGRESFLYMRAQTKICKEKQRHWQVSIGSFSDDKIQFKWGEARRFFKIELGFRKLELLFKWVHYNFRRNCLSYFSAVDFGR